MNKRGSHIDVILSFIIFIAFIVFFYAIIQTNVIAKSDKTAFLNFMGGQLVKNLTGINLTAISIQLNPNNPRSCLVLTGFQGSAGINSMSLVLKNLTGETFPVYKSGGDLYIDMSQNQNAKFFKVYYSPNFNIIADNVLGACNPALQVNPPNNPPNTYSINKKEDYTSNYIWESSISSLINSYKQDYISVKEWFNVSIKDNFGFSFTYQNNTIVSTNETIPLTINVYSQTFPVAYISANNSLQSGNLIVRVW
jgi:hypothetical protein